MKEKKGLSRERMRYAVPGVCNRFFGVHAPFIALCAALCAIIITVTLAAVVVFGVQELEPKPSLVFFCEVEDIELVRTSVAKHERTFDIYFVEYGDRGMPESEAPSGERFTADGKIVKYTAAAVLYTINGYNKKEYAYFQFDIKEGGTLTLSDIEKIIALAREEL